jgi:HemY protein
MISRPIRNTLWVLGLAALAVALALAGRYGSGYVVFVVPPYRIELSVMLFFLLTLIAFIATYALLRLTKSALRLPRALKAKKHERARAKSRTALYGSMKALFSGQFREAERQARVAMSAEMAHEGTRDLAAAVAAWAAHEGGNSDAAVPYLERIRDAKSGAMRDASMAYMLLAEGRAKEALPLLKDLAESAPKNPGVLKMKVEAEMAEKAWEDVLATLGPLTRSGLMPEQAAQQIRTNAELHLINTKPANREAIMGAWKATSRESRYDVNIVIAVAKRLNAIGCGDDARTVIEETVDERGPEGWDSALASSYAECKTDATLAQIERAERWLRDHARDAVLLATLGKLCMRQSLWGRAQSYLEASVALEPSTDAHMTLARLMEQIGKRDEAINHIRRSAELAR